MELSHIYEGWRNQLFPPKELKEQIQRVKKERMEICEACENHSKHHPSVRPDTYCIICGCTLSAKTACLSCSCPIYKWKKVLTAKQEEEIKEGDGQE